MVTSFAAGDAGQTMQSETLHSCAAPFGLSEHVEPHVLLRPKGARGPLSASDGQTTSFYISTVIVN